MLQWADNFSQYGTGTTIPRQFMTDGLYATAAAASLAVDPDPTASGNVLYFNNTNPSFDEVRRVLTAGRTTVGVAARFWLPNLPASSPVNLIRFQNGSNVNQVALLCTSTGQLVVYRGEGWSGSPSPVTNTQIAASAGPVLVAGAYNHIEMKVFFDNAAGTVEVRVNGSVIAIDADTLDTLNSGTDCQQISFVNRWPNDSEGTPFYMKDLVIWDDQGSHNTDFLGTVSVVSLFPDADVSFNWTPSTGTTGFNLIDEAPPNDADYIEAADPPPAASVFSLSDLPDDVTSVRGLFTVVRARKTDGGDGNLQVGLISAGDTDLGADRPLTTAFTFWTDLSETSPDTGVAWTPVEVDAADIQVDRTL